MGSHIQARQRPPATVTSERMAFRAGKTSRVWPRGFGLGATESGRRQLRVIRVVPTAGQSLPVYPDEQTCSKSAGMSQRCQCTIGDIVGLAWYKEAVN
jgi:hypothetical protein